uniref:hypothetical protein n=1 Tax=Alloprevotella sp. TaxID=1872471 RepID=UPI0040267734
MKKYFMSVAALAGMMSLAACSSDDIVSPADNDVQTIKIAVASTGDKSTRSRDLNSEEPAQNIGNVAVVIRNKATNEVVYQKVITNWNLETVSKPYTDNGHGRECTLKLEGNDRLNAGEYTITAVGYTADDFKNNTIESATMGKVVSGNFTAEVPDDKAAQEAFAGESSINLLENHAAINTSVTLHRQVAGYYGYFTSIPVKVNNKTVTDVRLVARSKNTKLTYGNFNSSFTTTNNNIMYVVNGSEAATTKDAKFKGSADNDAYTLYNIKVAEWFTQGDMNNDGILDEKDALMTTKDGKEGWTNALESKGYKTYQKGTIFAGGFAVPFAATADATLELQLLDASGEILKSWTVAMATPQPTGQDVEKATLPVAETAQNFSFFRNHMYTLGKKMDNTTTPGTTPDQPEPLDKSQSMILRVNDNWEVINRMTIGD